MKGLIHVYTGDGKGKTTAALGLALRAAGRGRQVIVLQFLKGRSTGEIAALQSLPQVTLLRNSRDYGFFAALDATVQAQIRQEHNANLARAFTAVEQGRCDLLILDEAAAAYQLNALDRAAIDQLLCHKPESLELVLTGRDAPPSFLAAADYISEIRKIKHPFDEGIMAREGIEF